MNELRGNKTTRKWIPFLQCPIKLILFSLISRWRAERKESDLKKEVSNKKDMLASIVAGRKAWTLDGDDDE